MRRRAAQHRQQQCFVARKTRRLAKRSQEKHAPRVMKLSASVLGLALAAAELRHVAGEAGEWDADLHLHPPSTVEKFNVRPHALFGGVTANGNACAGLSCPAACCHGLQAKCLDGSPGGYYYRKASNPAAATKWKFHFMGGGTARLCVHAIRLCRRGISAHSLAWAMV